MQSCTDNVRDITGGDKEPETPSAEVKAFDITTDGFDFLEKMQGHWVGDNLVMTDEYAWFAWDYRAISSSHIHGIHEGGSLGNLFTSFFVTNFKGTKTLMARNGGVLNGIYRTSYFVLDKVEDRGVDGKYYRFVDGVGGAAIMYMELRFEGDNLFFNSYTSNLGSRVPNRHMTFKGKKMHIELAQAAASATNFPTNEINQGLDFSNGFVTENLYAQEGKTPKSATFLYQQANNDVYEMAPLSGDPYTITDHPRLGSLVVNITRNATITNDNLLVYLSKDALTDTDGYLTSITAAYDTLLHFPVLENQEDYCLFTYLHPGDYYLTVVADKNGDGAPSEGDILSISTPITIQIEENKETTVTNVNVQN